MKVFVTLLVFVIVFQNHAIAQVANHPTIQRFSIMYEDGNPKDVSKIIDSPVVVIYVVELKADAKINKVYVRISSGKSSEGNLLSTSYSSKSDPVINEQHQTVFRREKDIMYIRTITTNKITDMNFEVYTEDIEGKNSPVLNWKK